MLERLAQQARMRAGLTPDGRSAAWLPLRVVLAERVSCELPDDVPYDSRVVEPQLSTRAVERALALTAA